MRMSHVLGLALVVSLVPATSARAEVKLTMTDGLVSITATNATVREILAEWAKVGKTQIVNAERVSSAPMSIQLNNVYESQALDVIMRSVSAYIAAPRPQIAADASRFDRIVILPTSTPPRNPATPTPPAFAQPPMFNPPPPPTAFDDDDDVAARNQAAQAARGPIFNTFPQPPNFPGQQGVPQRVVAPTQSTQPGQVQMPVGVAVPGMVAQPPPQVGQPGQIQPVR
jgi:hypothetical protein